MPALTRADLNYEYEWTATKGDDPKKTAGDSHHLSRKEGYEMLPYLNSLTGEGGADLSKKTRLIVEWMLHEHYESTAPSRATVTAWVSKNFSKLKDGYPF
ncbi:hypothetical protein HX866_04135 [Pseudomonas gingeri]|uniref:hypothetical protein n=1 Tax=Pseudomonas gingeri TaxID=117681 RepID=UPI0015A1C038|nr:hypothetical protein [Pseudomonas gingeri]NWA24072.1 hypothetical protein [Pseudomonas gingeri]